MAENPNARKPDQASDRSPASAGAKRDDPLSPLASERGANDKGGAKPAGGKDASQKMKQLAGATADNTVQKASEKLKQPEPVTTVVSKSTSSSKGKKPEIAEVASGKFKITRKLGAGSFGDVYLGVNNQTGEDVAIKMENAKGAYPQLFYEAKLLDTFKGGQGITSMYHIGSEKGHNVLVMELMGPCLEDLLNLCKGRFSLKTTLMIGEQILRRIEFVHSKGYLHRDIKPENFLVGRNDRMNKVYIIDFGLSKRYCDAKTKEHMEYKDGRDLTGTARYASVNAHKGIEQSRRDDLEAIGYMLMFFQRGNLPWQGLPAKTKSEKYRRIKEVKSSTPLGELCKGFPDEFKTYLQYCKGLGFKDKPDYAYLRKLFKDLLTKSGHELDYVFDWSKGPGRPVTPEGDDNIYEDVTGVSGVKSVGTKSGANGDGDGKSGSDSVNQLPSKNAGGSGCCGIL